MWCWNTAVNNMSARCCCRSLHSKRKKKDVNKIRRRSYSDYFNKKVGSRKENALESFFFYWLLHYVTFFRLFLIISLVHNYILQTIPAWIFYSLIHSLLSPHSMNATDAADEVERQIKLNFYWFWFSSIFNKADVDLI